MFKKYLRIHGYTIKDLAVKIGMTSVSAGNKANFKNGKNFSFCELHAIHEAINRPLNEVVDAYHGAFLSANIK